MEITHDNERRVIDTKVESYHIRLEGQAEFLTDRVYLHGRIIGLDGKYIGQYNDTSVRLLDKTAIEYRTEASQAIDELINYVSQLNILNYGSRIFKQEGSGRFQPHGRGDQVNR